MVLCFQRLGYDALCYSLCDYSQTHYICICIYTHTHISQTRYMQLAAAGAQRSMCQSRSHTPGLRWPGPACRLGACTRSAARRPPAGPQVRRKGSKGSRPQPPSPSRQPVPRAPRPRLLQQSGAGAAVATASDAAAGAAYGATGQIPLSRSLRVTGNHCLSLALPLWLSHCNSHCCPGRASEMRPYSRSRSS
jgi:hypothetical protein